MDYSGRKKRQRNGKETTSNAKTDVRYWEGRVFKAQDRARGGTVLYEADTYSVKFQHGGWRHALSLHTANVREAAVRAREGYLFLITNGWEAFFARYRSPEAASAGVPLSPRKNVTVGEYLEAVRLATSLSVSLIESYAKAFRFLVSELAGIRATKARFDYRGGGHAEWLKRVHAVPLGEITPEKVLAWKKERSKAGRSAANSANSTLRRARALFSRRNVIAHLKGLELPARLPFEGVALERGNSRFYGCGVEAHALLAAAVGELGGDKRRLEEFKVFLLGLAFGLRRREIDLLEWSSFDFGAGLLALQPTKWYALKTPQSAATLPVEPEIGAAFRAWKLKATSGFVIESERAPKSVGYQYYRCQEVFDRLLGWLRAQGVQGARPLHQLRKLYGSALNDLHGIHAASLGLRHSDIRVTSEHYADARVKLSPGFGADLVAAASVVALPPPAQARNPKRRASP